MGYVNDLRPANIQNVETIVILLRTALSTTVTFTLEIVTEVFLVDLKASLTSHLNNQLAQNDVGYHKITLKQIVHLFLFS